MKKKSIIGIFYLTAIVAGLFCFGSVSAQKQGAVPERAASPAVVSPIRVDDFAYAAGQLTDAPAGAGANVSGGAWVTNTGTGSFIQVTAGSLSYAGYPSSGVGNRMSIVSVTTSAEDTFRNFPTQTSGTTYAAFMVNVTDTTGLAANTSTTGDYFAGFISSTSTTSFVNRVTIRAGSVPNTYNLGFRATGNAGNVQAFAATDLPVGTTALVVISYQLVAGTTNDICNMWINPVITGPEPAATLSQVSAADNSDVGRFFVRQGNAGTPNASIDGLRVATSWAGLVAPYVSNAPVDFDGDGKTDYAVVRNVGGVNGQLRWFYNLNAGGPTVALDWGLDNDVLTPADFDGDGKTDVSVWRPGPALSAAFYILNSATSTLRIEQFGQNGDDPTVVRDYSGDGKADVAVYRPGAQGTWYYRSAVSGPVTYVPWGTTNDIPVAGDYDGDGVGDFAVVRNNGGQSQYWMLRSTAGVGVAGFGPYPTSGMGAYVPGDFDGDSKTDFAFADGTGATGVFYYQPSSGGSTVIIFGGNPATDELVPGDYDGDGKTDIAIWRNGVFWVRNSSNSAWSNFTLGSAGDRPVAAYFDF